MTMREILFRGKDIVNGKWVSGFLVSEKHIGSFLVCEPVRPETIGQFTGLNDKNGKKIFEGDIIKTRHGIRYIVFEDGCFGARPNDRLFAALRNYNRELNGDWEVIGNIHDNPELLEVK
jgi:hypothetical protein